MASAVVSVAAGGLAGLLATALTAAAAFAATNVDDVVDLTALFALAAQDGPLRRRHVVVGQALGLGLLVAVSWVGAAGLLLVPDDVVGLLGLVPLALGVLGVLILAESGLLGRALGGVTG